MPPCPAPSPAAVTGSPATSMPSHRTKPANLARSSKPKDCGATHVHVIAPGGAPTPHGPAGKPGNEHGCDLFALRAPADDLLRPLRHRLVQVNRETPGRADVPSASVHHAEATSARHAVAERSLLVVVGPCGEVGGQEDVITNGALDLLITQEAAA